MSIVETHFLAENSKGKLMKYPVTLDYRGGQIWFVKSPFAMKDEIKAMQGARWRGFDDPPVKQWSVRDCPRNRFQIEWLEGGNPYAHFEQPIIEHVKAGYTRKTQDGLEPPLWHQQITMINHSLTLRYQILAACMGAGKTAVAFELMERSGAQDIWFVAPKTVLHEIKLQAEHWMLNTSLNVTFMTYDKMTSLVKSGAYDLPQAVFFDEASKAKTAGSARTAAAQTLADRIREVHGFDGMAILMSGTPSPKTPLDIWALAEIAWPGFLREGSPKALEQRLAILRPSERASEIGGHFNERVGWLDADGLCGHCGLDREEHDMICATDPAEAHAFVPSVNEVALLNERLKGLMVVVHKKDCIDLPEKTYVEINLSPGKKLLKVAAAVQRTAMTTVQGLAQLRQLSDGFMYREETQGTKVCPTCNGTGEVKEWFNPEEPDRPYGSLELMDPEKCKNFEERMTQCVHCMGSGVIDNVVRVTVPVPCPKTEVVEDLLDKASDKGRILFFAGFIGSVDRLVTVCQNAGWDVFRCDGRGSVILGTDNKQVAKAEPLRYWRDTMTNRKVAFVANPESGGFGLTLTEANIACFYSNSYKPEFRIQAEERLHRPGQVDPVKIYDLLHLPSDKRTLDIIRSNRKLEQMVLGDILGDCFTSAKVAT